jgi:hypothetical protein
VPITAERNFIKDYKAFVTNLIVNLASLDDSANDNFLQKILNYIKSDIFSLGEFNRLIADLKVFGSGIKNERILLADESSTGNEFYESKPASVPAKPGRTETDRVLFLNQNKLLRILLPQALIILASAIICIILVSKNIADISTVFGLVLIAASIDTLVLSKTVLKKENNAAENVNSNKEKQVQIKKTEAMNKPIKSRGSSGPVIAARGLERSAAGVAVDYIQANDTIVIGEHSGEYPYLESIGMKTIERIALSKDKFVIGRLKSYVDYAVLSNSVGKVHAEITKVEGSYYVKDLNSKNGTYINNERVPSNKEYVIKADDRIRFANLEYIFKA